MKKAGYKTFMVGKWHLKTEPEFLPCKQGFDHYYGMPCNFAHSPKFFANGTQVFAKAPVGRPPLSRPANEPLNYQNCENLQAVRRGDWRQLLPGKAEQFPHLGHEQQLRLKAGKLDIGRDDAETLVGFMSSRMRTTPQAVSDTHSKDGHLTKRSLKCVNE